MILLDERLQGEKFWISFPILYYRGVVVVAGRSCTIGRYLVLSAFAPFMKPKLVPPWNMYKFTEAFCRKIAPKISVKALSFKIFRSSPHLSNQPSQNSPIIKDACYELPIHYRVLRGRILTQPSLDHEEAGLGLDLISKTDVESPRAGFIKKT
uniref:Uncharacterized protein n=1 Tax=Romanomermis culicivorax TaxID=13658 RepID=A0A915JKP1_ROMCU